MSDSVMSAPVCDSIVRFACWIWTAKASSDQPTSALTLRNIHDQHWLNIEAYFKCRKICVHETLKDWENGVPTRPDCAPVSPACDRVTSQKTAYYRPTTGCANTGEGDIRLRDQLRLAARQQEIIHCLDLCLLGACLLVTSVSLVASCKKWTCPPDNHARTFYLSGDILACPWHTDWHYFEPWAKQIGPMNGLEGWTIWSHPSKRDLVLWCEQSTWPTQDTQLNCKWQQLLISVVQWYHAGLRS